MITETIRSLFLRELRALRREIASYSDETMLWELRGGVANPAGSLAMHLCGNLQHFVGAKLGHTGYIRDRDAEFASRGVSREGILAEIDATTRAVDVGFARLSDADLAKPFPELIGNVSVPTGEWLLHLVAHLGYHVGQIDYHRRMVTGDARTLDVASTKELPSTLAKP
jgi:uncharacterized damage-inducible protein DinB